MDLALILLLLFGATSLALEVSRTLRARRVRRAVAVTSAPPGLVVRGAVAPPADAVLTVAKPRQAPVPPPAADESLDEVAARWAWVDQVSWDPDSTTLAGASTSLSGPRD
jgi:hypothetical protein